MPPNATSENTLTQRNVRDDNEKDQELIIENDWQLPEFSIKEIRDHIPNELFKRDLLKSSYWVVHDLFIVGALFYAATHIHRLPYKLQFIAWPAYWIAQGIVATGVWVLGHECGHQAFSDYRVNSAEHQLIDSLPRLY
jgi:omega-6 fatty acid desaturase (delta-12 desaturase)